MKNLVGFLTETDGYREFPIDASEFINNFFNEEDIENPKNLKGVDFSEYDIESTEPHFSDMQDMLNWLKKNYEEEFTIRTYKNGINALVGDMDDKEDVVIAKDIDKYGPIYDVKSDVIMSH